MRRSFIKKPSNMVSQNTPDVSNTLSKRLYAVDELRGFCLILMILYHIFYDITSIFGVSVPLFELPIIDTLRDCLVFTFITISGISRNLAGSNIKNAIKILLATMAISFVMYFMDMPIYFGILHFAFVAILLAPTIKRIIIHIPPKVFYPLVLALFLILKPVPDGYIGIKNLYFLSLPKVFYSQKWLFFLGFPSSDFVSYDYFPIIPWIFAFAFGLYIGRNFKASPASWAKTSVCPFLGKMGRHSLWIYLIHQPVILALMYIIEYIFKTA